MHIFNCYFVGKEEAPKDDPYGSLWMETEEPSKIKKRRRSNFILDILHPASVEEDNEPGIHVTDDRAYSKANRQASDSVDQNDVISMQQYIANKQSNESSAVSTDSHRIESRDQSEERNIRINDNGVSMEEDSQYQPIAEVSTVMAESQACENNKREISADSAVHELKTTSTELSPKETLPFSESDTREKKGEDTQSNSEGTPSDDIQLTTPQSMSPDFPMSPTDMAYLGSHDDSYIGFLPSHQILDKSNTDAVLHTNDVNANVNENSDESTERMLLTKVTDENNELDASLKSLEASVSDKEDTVLSLSDKENTVIENKSADQVDEGRQSESPGFLSLCKAFADKVVDLVKTSPSYLSNILQDNKANNSESPSLTKEVLAKAVSPEASDKSFSEIKLALESELNKSLEKSVQCPKQVIQVYSVTEMTKGNNEKCENEEKGGNGGDENIEKEAAATVTNQTKKVAGKAKTKRRKSSSKMFFDTFNAVSNELNKVSNSNESVFTCNRQIDEIDGFSEHMSCPSTSQAAEPRINPEVETLLTQVGNVDLEIQNSDSLVPAETISKTTDVDVLNKDNDNSVYSSHSKNDRSRNEQKKHRKRRSTDIHLLNDKHHSREKLKKEENSNNSATKRKQLATIKDNLASQTSFTQIKEIEQSKEIESEKSETNDSHSNIENSSSSSNANSGSVLPSLENNDVSDLTDSTSSVLEGISKLDLEVTLPLPDVFRIHTDKNKKDRRRRRSNNFYFSSIYNDAEEKQNENYEKAECATNVDKTNVKQVNIVSSETLVQDVHEVTEEISQVKLNDGGRIEKSGKDTVHRLPDIEEEAETEPNNSDSVIDENEAFKQSDSNTKNTDNEVNNNQLLDVTAESVEDTAPRRRRRRSADAAVLKIQMQALDTGNSPVVEQASASPGPSNQKQGRKRKKATEIPLEDIYRNKNYVKPQDKTWETIFESPKSDQLFSKRKVHTHFNFEDNTFYKPTQEKVKKRQKRAVKNGWDPKKRKRQAISEDVFQVKIANIFSELDEEGSSISDKIKDIIEY